jgi:hypothetical protein
MGWGVHLGRKDKGQPTESESSELRASVDQLSSLSLVALAVELVAKAFTGQAGQDDDQPPWVDPFGRGPSAYEVANWLYLPRDQELDTSQPLGLALYGLVSEALQVLEHASLVRSQLRFGYQGSVADAHMTYVLTRYGVSVRDAGAVEHVLNGGTLSS